MIDLTNIKSVYLYTGNTDFRLGINSLTALISSEFKGNLNTHTLFLFCNKRRTQVKVLEFDDYGKWQYYKDENPFVCVMTNTALPNLTLYTAPVKVQHTVDAITSTAAESDLHVSVEGRTLCAENGSNADIILTDMNGRQLAKAFGSLRHTVAAPGIYLVITEKRAAKVVVK